MYVNAICLPRARRAPARLGKSEKTESGCNALPSTHDHAVVVPGAARVLVSRLGSTRPRAIARPYGWPVCWGQSPSWLPSVLWPSHLRDLCLASALPVWDKRGGHTAAAADVACVIQIFSCDQTDSGLHNTSHLNQNARRYTHCL